jgi:hypothetical protein
MKGNGLAEGFGILKPCAIWLYGDGWKTPGGQKLEMCPGYGRSLASPGEVSERHCVSADSILEVMLTTGPSNTTADGRTSFHIADFGYTAARSHRIPSMSQQCGSGCGERASAFIRRASACCSSQYWRTRRSVMRCIANLVGGVTSDASIGSHTTNTRTLAAGCRARSSSTAEAPRRQPGHVGDKSRMTRKRSEAALNSRLNSSSDCGCSLVSGG